MDRRVDVAEVPLVSRDLAVRVHVVLAQHEAELLLAEIRVDERQGEHVEGEVPGRVPGVLPLVRHRDHIAVVHVVPVLVAGCNLPRRLEGVGPALLQPPVHVVVVELLGPEHARQRLPHHVRRVGVEGGRGDGRIEFVGLLPASPQHLLVVAPEGSVGAVRPQDVGRTDLGEAQANDAMSARLDGEAIVGRGFRARPPGIHGLRPAQDHAVVDAVLDVRGPVGDAEDALRVGLVLREQEGHISVAVQVELAEFGVRRGHDHAGRGAIRLPEQRPVAARPPGPQVAEPERRQDVEFGRVGPAIVGRELDEDVLRRFLGILDEHVEVAVLVEDTGIEQLILELAFPPPPIRFQQVGIGECRLGILIQVLHVRVRRRAIQVEVVFLDVLAVIALAVGEPEQALLEDRVRAVPQRQCEAEPLLPVGEAGQAVLPPAVGARASLVMAEVVPGVAALAVVLTHGTPLALAEVRTP